MAASHLPLYVPVEEYLHTEYEHDMDYVDGLLEERDPCQHDHADLQTEIATLFRNHRGEWKVKAVIEQRVKISPTRYRVPDLCILPTGWKREPIITGAPLLCIEVLSPEDRLNRTIRKCNDFFQAGTRECWIFDPEDRTVMVLRPGGTMTTHSASTLTLEGTAITVPLAEVFAVLDEN